MVRVALGFFVPLEDVFEAVATYEQLLLGDVVDEESAGRVFVEAAGDGLVVVGAAGVPDFKLDGEVFDDDCLGDELGAGGGRQGVAEGRVDEAAEDAGLADVWVRPEYCSRRS